MRRSIWEQIQRSLMEIRFRLDDIEKTLSQRSSSPLFVSEDSLLMLPDHLRKCYVVVVSKGECTATEVSNVTGRSRSLESNYLNQLVRQGMLLMRRISKNSYFSINEESNLKKVLSSKKYIGEGKRVSPSS